MNRREFLTSTAQHALPQAVHGAKNIVAAIRGKRKTPLAFNTLGQLATIGRRTGVASILGLHVSGLFAWWLWRTIYLAKLPRFKKKLRVALHWTLDLFFPKDFVQHSTLHGIDRVHRRVAFFREHPGFPRRANLMYLPQGHTLFSLKVRQKPR